MSSLAIPKRLIVERRDESRLDAIRRTMIGGTDIAPILGVSERRTRFAVWAAKVRADVADDTENEEEAAAGTYLEPFILRRFAERHGVVVEPTPYTYRLHAAPFLGINPDAVIRDKPKGLAIAGVDAKSRSPFVRNQWGAPGTDAIPPDEFCQGQWYCHIANLPLWYFPVLFDRQLVVFVIRRDAELGQLMQDEATAFWNDFVVPEKEPPFEGPVAADYLRRKYPHPIVPAREANESDTKLVLRRDALRKAMDKLQLQLDSVEGDIKARIGDADGLVAQGWKATWYEREGGEKTDWHAVVTELRSFPLHADPEVAAAVTGAIDRTVQRYTTATTPTRVLRVTFRGPRAVLGEEETIAAIAAKEAP